MPISQKKILLFATLCLSVFCILEYPILPDRFSQDFVIGFNDTGKYTVGKIWYDNQNKQQRMDYQNSQLSGFCNSITKGIATPCSQIWTKNSLYVILRQKSQCCKCCTYQQGCTIADKNQFKNYTFAGQAILSGESFNNWTSFDGAVRTNFYVTKGDKAIPRRWESLKLGFDYIMNTYSENQINPTVFNVQSNCEATCPKQSVCSQFVEQSQTLNNMPLYNWSQK